MNRIDGKIAVITGGSQGLGAAIACSFAEAGAAGIALVGRGTEKGCCQTKSNRSQSTMITQIYEAQI